jgi:predicted NUDIX family phosphoesterase
LYSVGIGGHISEEDHQLFSNNRGYQESMRRELMEEVGIDTALAPALAAINDDSTEVGYVHFGVVHAVRVPDESVASRRIGIVGPEFIPMADAVKDTTGYESWSRFCLDHLDALLAKLSCS